MRHSLTSLFLAVAGVMFLAGESAVAQSVMTTLQLVPSNDPINELELSIAAGLVGNDTDKATLSGSIEATFDYTNNAVGYDFTGVTLTGGLVSISDVSFSLNFGLSADGTGLSAVPFTSVPPGTISSGVFDAAEHGVTVNQGTVVAAGNTIDFGIDPFVGTGEGSGTVTATPGTAISGFDVFDLVLDLPVAFDEPFEIPNIPFVGTITAQFSGTGIMRATAVVQIPASGLACDDDADGDCDVDDIDALYAQIAAGTSGGAFDFDGDGTTTPADIEGWLAVASDPANSALPDPENDVLVVGDIDMNGDVDSTDLGLLLNNFGSTSAPGWGGGDLNADFEVNSTDLGLLLNNFGQTSLASSVPEPSSGSIVYIAVLGVLMIRRVRSVGQ